MRSRRSTNLPFGTLRERVASPALIVQATKYRTSRLWAKLEAANGHKIKPDGTHIVAAKHSVVQLDANDNLLKVIASEFNGKPLKYPNDITIDEQGGFYFTDSGDSNRLSSFSSNSPKNGRTGSYDVLSPKKVGQEGGSMSMQLSLSLSYPSSIDITLHS
ncbi:hypothetical protein WA1_25030 [Scytonema hofmannii PCC 7110]|uniref:SMP-30/Gluconolactonase/LRE-like region domain-containing protein n=2 Tax=Scytonema hofmannii TaxID=34078 RepID=A0A139X881_9CYAN|nr:hypothetical protein WA1_25030 [Scytonema hofmannii PCC 7110]